MQIILPVFLIKHDNLDETVTPAISIFFERKAQSYGTLIYSKRLKQTVSFAKWQLLCPASTFLERQL